MDPRALVGMTLDGRWRVHDIIGEGATATVLRATGPKGEPAAIKLLHFELARDGTLRRRFLLESEVSQSLNVPGVVRIFGTGETSAHVPYIAMELLLGETLEARWKRKEGRLPVFEVLWVTDRVLDVLIAAHKKGIVHRDIKPENIFLCTTGEVKLLDFGVAKLRSAVMEHAPMTQAGHLVGTLAFMPPEQARGERDAINVQSDLWALGATMFTLLSGRLVHSGEDITELFISATAKPPPSLREVLPDAPDALVELVDFALCFEIPKRWPSAYFMQRAVREVAILVQRRLSRKIDVANPSEDVGPVSEELFEIPGRLEAVSPPPMTQRPPFLHSEAMIATTPWSARPGSGAPGSVEPSLAPSAGSALRTERDGTPADGPQPRGTLSGVEGALPNTATRESLARLEASVAGKVRSGAHTARTKKPEIVEVVVPRESSVSRRPVGSPAGDARKERIAFAVAAVLVLACVTAAVAYRVLG